MSQMTYGVADDGSLVDGSNRILHFSSQRFDVDIRRGNKCFVCGADPAAVAFSNEHVLPKWLLRKFNLFERTLALPNGTSFKYRSYTTPCCKACNSLLGKEIEEPIRAFFTSTYDDASELLVKRGPHQLFVWICLLFLKTHLRDLSFDLVRDRRSGAGKVGDLHDWSAMHHIHCIARSPYTGIALDRGSIGSVFVLPAQTLPELEPFDFADLSYAQTVLIRVNDIAVIAVLNDACGVFNAIWNYVSRIEGPLSPLQLRELLARIAVVNLHLTERPIFQTSLESSGSPRILAQIPEKVEISAFEATTFGRVMWAAVGEFFSRMGLQSNIPDIKQNILAGKVSYLFDNDNRFIRHSFLSGTGGAS